MKIFSIELSARHGSIATIDDGTITAEASWVESFKDRQQLFDAMAAMNINWDTVDLFAVGRGPGSFSGMRIGFSVANSLAAPGDKPVYALNSGASLAAQILADRIAIVGDARRNKVWAGVFSGNELENNFQLMERDELASFVPQGVLVVSPDHDRLESLLSEFTTLDNAEPVFPTAGSLGQLVYERLKKSIKSESLEPLYMHPPVFIEPRFPA